MFPDGQTSATCVGAGVYPGGGVRVSAFDGTASVEGLRSNEGLWYPFGLR